MLLSRWYLLTKLLLNCLHSPGCRCSQPEARSLLITEILIFPKSHLCHSVMAEVQKCPILSTTTSSPPDCLFAVISGLCFPSPFSRSPCHLGCSKHRAANWMSYIISSFSSSQIWIWESKGASVAKKDSLMEQPELNYVMCCFHIKGGKARERGKEHYRGTDLV